MLVRRRCRELVSNEVSFESLSRDFETISNADDGRLSSTVTLAESSCTFLTSVACRAVLSTGGTRSNYGASVTTFRQE